MKLIKTEDEQGVMYSLSGDNLPENYALSDKNCQDIERGYDLDELADECQNILIKDNWRESPSQKIAFTLGFQKALEILGDKKFSEKQLKFAYNRGSYDDRLNNKKLFNADKYIQSLQQTEWDCIIETEDKIAIDGHTKIGIEPKFDSKGRLILKKI